MCRADYSLACASSCFSWRRSVASMRERRGASEASARRMATKVSVMRTDAATAVGEFNTDANMIMPCSVKAYGRYRLPPQLEVTICDLKFEGFSMLFRGAFRTSKSSSALEVTICDLKFPVSSLVNWNMNRSGKRSMLRFTA